MSNLPSSREIVRDVLAKVPRHQLEDALTETIDVVVAGLTDLIKRGVLADLTRERDLYRNALAVLVDDAGGQVTIPLRHLTEAAALDEVGYTASDEEMSDGPDVTFRIVVKE